jgi:hypothetical protein
VVADTAASGYPATNLANPSTSLRWVAADTTDQYLTVTTGSAEAIDYMAVARHNFGVSAVTVSVEGRTASDGEWTELVEEFLPADDTPLVLRFTPQALYQVRLKMQPASAAPAAAVLYVGALLVVPHGLPVGFTPIPYGRETEITNGRAESGDFLGRIVRTRRLSSRAGFQYLDGDWYRANFEPFVRVAQTTPFFFAWAPASYPREAGYCWLTSDPRPSIDQVGGEISVSLDYSGVAL